MEDDDHERLVKQQLLNADSQGKNGKPFVKKLRKYKDPHLHSTKGRRGICRLCGSFSDLTEDHVPPQCTGNKSTIYVRSYHAKTCLDWKRLTRKKYPKGVVFRTICADCNSKLGANEDQEISKLFSKANWLSQTPLDLGPVSKVKVRPNLVYRGLMAHMAAANELSGPDEFDRDAQALFSGKVPCNEAVWNLYYWPYSHNSIFLMRSAFIAFMGRPNSVHGVYILKISPLAFLFTKDEFLSFPNIRLYLTRDDREERDIPLLRRPADANPIWPVEPSDDSGSVIFSHAGTYGILGER